MPRAQVLCGEEQRGRRKPAFASPARSGRKEGSESRFRFFYPCVATAGPSNPVAPLQQQHGGQEKTEESISNFTLNNRPDSQDYTPDTDDQKDSPERI